MEEIVQRPPEPRASTLDVWLAVAGLLGIVALGIWAIYWVKRWREEAVDFDSLSDAEQLERYQQMADDGELDPEELVRIKARLEMRKSQAPPPAADQPPDASIQE